MAPHRTWNTLNAHILAGLSKGLVMFTWFDRKEDFLTEIRSLDAYRTAAEAWIESKKTVSGYCRCCGQMTSLQVTVGGYYGSHPNLREAMKCKTCGLSNRNRLLYHAVTEAAARVEVPQIALLERMSPLFGALQQRFPTIIGSEYLGEEMSAGTTHTWQGYEIRHESITNLSYGGSTLDFLVHCDVLEHVHDYRSALQEAARVLRPNHGTMLCTVPFFMNRNAEQELARPNADGSIEFFGPAEYHGDGMRPDGILTWHHFGWKLLEDVIAAGFTSAHIGLAYDPFCGYTTNNHPSFDYGLMYPLILRAQR